MSLPAAVTVMSHEAPLGTWYVGNTAQVHNATVQLPANTPQVLSFTRASAATSCTIDLRWLDGFDYPVRHRRAA